MGKPIVFLCRGPKCRKKRRAVCEALAPLAHLEEVPCQKICEGPVVGLAVDQRLDWFARVDTKKARKGLVDLVTAGKLTKALKKRRRKERRGKLRS